VKNLVDEPAAAGTSLAFWDGTDRRGRPVSAGVYLVRLAAGSEVETQKVVVVR
jgi:hypothetical protein